MHSKVNHVHTGKNCRTAAIVVLMLLCLSSRKSLALDPAKNLSQYVLRAWTTQQGLPQDSIQAMLQTRDGFLWVGTRGGLARFDGASFKIYKAGVANSIPGESVTGLAEDRDGSLWIASDGGLTRYHNGRFENYTSCDGLPENSIWHIAADSAGGVWAITWRSELIHFDGKAVRKYDGPFTGRPQGVTGLVEDHYGTLWISTYTGLFALGSSGSFTLFTQKDGLAGDRIYAIALDLKGELWTAGEGGLTHIALGRFTRIQIPGLSAPTLVAFDPSGSGDSIIWTGSRDEGLFRLSPRGIQRTVVTGGLLSDEIDLLYCTRDGSVWAGALDRLNQLGDGTVTSYAASENLPASLLGIQRAQGPNGELWFGHDQLVVQVGDRSVAPIGGSNSANSHDIWQTTLRGLYAVSVLVRSNDPARQGVVLASPGGRSVLSDGTVQRPLPRINWNDVYTSLIARDGTIWTGGSSIGVIAYPIHGPPRSYTMKDGLDDNNVYSLAEDAAGVIWVGTISGLSRIQNGFLSHFISCAAAASIIVSADGGLWVGSNMGLIYVPRTLAPVRVFTLRDGLPTNRIEGVAEDKDGYLWLGTDQGIVRVDKADLFAPIHQPQKAPAVFGAADGIRNAQLQNNSVFRSRYGHIWFLTHKDLGMIDPRKIQRTPLTPIDIDRVRIDDHDIDEARAGTVRIAAGRHRLTIRYTLPEFNIPGRIHFRYRLDGWDKDWIDAGTLRDATYTGIPPGRYTFHVAHSDGYENWSSEESTLDIQVAPYFYQTVWFLSLMVLLLATIIWQMYRFRVAKVSATIDARMQERTRIARELHDTLLQGMLGVSMQMYAASQQSFQSDSLSATLGRLSQRLRQIAEQSRQAVENLRSPYLSLDSLETSLSRSLREMDLPSGLEPQVHSAGSPMSLHSAVQSEIERIVREAVANAVRHSGASSIQLDILYQPACLFVSISDDGGGIEHGPPESEQHGHWGITGMQERAQFIGGLLRIIPNAPRGTVVEFSLPGDYAYINPADGFLNSVWQRMVRRKKDRLDLL